MNATRSTNLIDSEQTNKKGVLMQTTPKTSAAAAAPRWPRFSLPQLVEHIVVAYHDPLRKSLARLNALIEHVRGTHWERVPARQEALDGIWTCFSALQSELEAHMDKEEEQLFPWILGDCAVSAKASAETMKHQHLRTEELLQKLRQLRAQYIPTADADADAATMSLLQELAEVDASLQAHGQLEEHLFLQALAP